ncbi:MAG: prolyl oligopeptidase family serine peptidase [Acidiferrobacterales bacterium]
MNNKKPATGGSWASPLTTDRIVSSSVSLAEPKIEGEDVYWLESRPLEGGRQAIVRYAYDSDNEDVVPPPFNVRNRVHEYGGGAYDIYNGKVFFCNYADGGIYLVESSKAPEPIYVAEGKRFADLKYVPSLNTLVCVCEDHSQANQEAENSLVRFDLAHRDTYQVIASGEDFYASPDISPNGRHIAWISWSHPDMPWDKTRLWLADIDIAGHITNARTLLDEDCSVFQPQWSPDNKLYFSSDEQNGWWNIHCWNGETIDVVCSLEAEFGLPQWQFGMSTGGFISADEMLVCYSQNGSWSLARLCTRTGELQKIRCEHTQVGAIHANGGRAVMLASSPTELPGIWLYDGSNRNLERLASSGSLKTEPEDISIGQPISYPVADGTEVHAFFYPPASARYRLLDNELPPLIVMSHGGPTAATSNAYSIKIQFWTSRGFAVLDVNYRGSTGYGRDYRQMLNGQWGIADVEDCVAGAKFLVARNKVDANRLAIRGSSAGGYTTLCALTFHQTFKAGASLYGIGDLETLARDTHKFESRYLDRLVGPYPKEQDLYRQRSPIHFIDQLNCPVIFLQGLQDKVVPPEQAESMVEALKQKGLMVEYVTFATEQHGFRSSESIQRAYREELAFYGRVFGFTPASN